MKLSGDREKRALPEDSNRRRQPPSLLVDSYTPKGSVPSVGGGVAVALDNWELWRRFHHAGTEMIITKTGRRMFPVLQVSVAGLDPEAEYSVVLEVVPTGGQQHHRLRFSGREWVAAGRGEAQAPPGARTHVHPDSPARGRHWMASPVSFSRLKLTNNSLDGRGHVVLTSMHRYVPRVHVVQAGTPTVSRTFSFPETEFVAVTAYQNSKITKLKIEHNPFAKGFREGGLSSKRRRADEDAAATTPADCQQRECQRRRRESHVHDGEDSEGHVAGSPPLGKSSPSASRVPSSAQPGGATIGHVTAHQDPEECSRPWADHDPLLLLHLWASLAHQQAGPHQWAAAATSRGCRDHHHPLTTPRPAAPPHRYLDPRLSLPPPHPAPTDHHPQLLLDLRLKRP